MMEAITVILCRDKVEGTVVGTVYRIVQFHSFLSAASFFSLVKV